eukprot:2863797-Alexandrium_andersonii.AAC.1
MGGLWRGLGISGDPWRTPENSTCPQLAGVLNRGTRYHKTEKLRLRRGSLHGSETHPQCRRTDPLLKFEILRKTLPGRSRYQLAQGVKRHSP